MVLSPFQLSAPPPIFNNLKTKKIKYPEKLLERKKGGFLLL
jgi:hypothetical protein